MAEYCNPKTEFDACKRPWVYTMLLGMSIEALLKAAIIYHQGTQIEKRPNGSLQLKRNLTTHKLDELAKNIGAEKFAVSADELLILKRLAAFVGWCGKYPVPKTSEQMMAIGTSSIEREKILALHKRLQDHLEQFESTLNDLV